MELLSDRHLLPSKEKDLINSSVLSTIDKIPYKKNDCNFSIYATIKNSYQESE